MRLLYVLGLRRETRPCLCAFCRETQRQAMRRALPPRPAGLDFLLWSHELEVPAQAG